MLPGYPQPLREYGKGVPVHKIDTAIWWEPNGYTYFFSGDRWSISHFSSFEKDHLIKPAQGNLPECSCCLDAAGCFSNYCLASSWRNERGVQVGGLHAGRAASGKSQLYGQTR